MGCQSCKEKRQEEIQQQAQGEKPLGLKILEFSTKVLLFIVAGSIASVVVIPFTLYMLYKLLFRDNKVDVTGTLEVIGKYFKKINDKTDDEYEDDDNNDAYDPTAEYEMAGVEDITEK